jgi:predicted acyltransferase
MSGVLKGAFAKRISGDKPSSGQAALAALIAGAAVTVLTYRVMRS